MTKKLTPEEKRIERILKDQIKRRIVVYANLVDNPDTKLYATYMDNVDKMLLTGRFDLDSIPSTV